MYIYIYTYIPTYLPTHLPTYVRTYIHTYMYIYIDIYTYIHIMNISKYTVLSSKLTYSMESRISRNVPRVADYVSILCGRYTPSTPSEVLEVLEVSGTKSSNHWIG